MKTEAGGKAAPRFIFNIKPIAGLCAVVLWLSRYVKVTVDSAAGVMNPVGLCVVQKCHVEPISPTLKYYYLKIIIFKV